MQYPDKSFETPYWKQNIFPAGIDEAGRGPLAGPVVAAAVILPQNADIPGINDSKKLSASKREKLFDVIIEQCLNYGIGIIEPDEIDRINILNAALKAMKQAVSYLNIEPGILLIDGNKEIDSHLEQITIVKGDSRCISIACASILAKVTRDRIMDEYHKKYSKYNFKQHKGYPTKEHLRLIREYGTCEIHRKTFRGTS